MIIRIKPFVVPGLILLGLALSLIKPSFQAPQFHVPPLKADAPVAAQLSQLELVSGVTPTVHSATAVELSNGNLLAMWYGGTREGHIDVALYSKEFNRQSQTWGEAKKVLDRHDLSAQVNRYIKKIGNPVLIKHPSGAIALIYVSVSLGGWATSQINMTVSYDEGQTWHASQQLMTSPFINVSTLVKNDGVIYEDGTLGITAYHEFIGEFSELIRVTLDGEVVNKYRMSSGDFTIQPSVLFYDDMNATALMRDSSRHTQKVQVATTADGGISWSPYRSLALDNPNSAVFAFVDGQQRSWMILNDANRNDEKTARANLALALSLDRGQSWQIKHYFENPTKDPNITAKYAYPWVTRSGDGQYHLMYTEDRERIKHLIFNEAWLETLL